MVVNIFDAQTRRVSRTMRPRSVLIGRHGTFEHGRTRQQTGRTPEAGDALQLITPGKYGLQMFPILVQRSPLFCANIVKKDPGRVRQNSLATAGTNFTKAGAQNKGDLCT